MCVFFFFKQKTADEMRISDWSSDVCSSDLNQATMLQNMAKNLQRLDYSSLGQITGALQRIDGLMIQAEGIAFEVSATDTAFRQQFPEQYDAAVTTDQFVADARTRWRNSMSAYHQTMRIQAQVVEKVQADGATLSELVMASDRKSDV